MSGVHEYNFAREIGLSSKSASSNSSKAPHRAIVVEKGENEKGEEYFVVVTVSRSVDEDKKEYYASASASGIILPNMHPPHTPLSGYFVLVKKNVPKTWDKEKDKVSCFDNSMLRNYGQLIIY